MDVICHLVDPFPSLLITPYLRSASGARRRVAGGDVLEALDDGRLAAAVLPEDEDERPRARRNDLAVGRVFREGGKVDDLNEFKK